jgi:hypothetical protein
MEAEILCDGDKAVELYIDDVSGEQAVSALGQHAIAAVERIPRKGSPWGILRFRLRQRPRVSELTASLSGVGFKVVQRHFQASPKRWVVGAQTPFSE